MNVTLRLGWVVVLCLGASIGWAADPSAGQQVEQTLEVAGAGSIGYLCYLPADYQSGGDKKWPLMLFLHGRGESFGPLSLVAKWGPPQIVTHDSNFKYILVSPQCPGSDSWNSDTQQKLLLALLDKVTQAYRVDADRVYLTGLSMGGFGSWKLAAEHPERFAAVAPICGGGKTEMAAQLAKMPLWVFHGDGDNAVPIKLSIDMVDAVRAAGNQQVRFTTLEHVGHNSWSAAYATPELYEWFDSHTISARKE